MDTKKQEATWEADCLHWRGRVLTGKYRHWCYSWDELPVDETTPEWPCECYKEFRKSDLAAKIGLPDIDG